MLSSLPASGIPDKSLVEARVDMWSNEGLRPGDTRETWNNTNNELETSFWNLKKEVFEWKKGRRCRSPLYQPHVCAIDRDKDVGVGSIRARLGSFSFGSACALGEGTNA